LIEKKTGKKRRKRGAEKRSRKQKFDISSGGGGEKKQDKSISYRDAERKKTVIKVKTTGRNEWRKGRKGKGAALGRDHSR